MPQLSLYLDDQTMETLRNDAAREGTSLSKHARHLISNNASSAWPAGFWDLYGSIDDPTFVRPPDEPYDLDDPCDFFVNEPLAGR